MFRSDTQHTDTYYAATAGDRLLPRPSLAESLRVDVCIVGAGFFGLYCALDLARAGKKVAVLEASRVGWGASGRNGGQMIIGFPCGMQRLKGVMGYARAKEMFDESRRAVQRMRTLMREEQIDCDLVEGHLEVAVLQRRVADLTDWISECQQEWGYDKLRFVDNTSLPQYLNSERYQAGIIDPEGAHIHPLKYVLGLARAAERAGVQIFEQSKVESYVEGPQAITVRVAGGVQVQCDQLVLAANAYVDRVEPRLAARMLPVGTFIGTTEVLGESVCRSLIPQNHAVYDNQFILEYFRTTADHRLLFGGKCTYLGGTPTNLPQAMKTNILRAFPQLKNVRMDYAWGGHIDITMRRMPDWGHRNKRVFWAQGFCGHGLVPTRVAATLVTEAMQGNTERLDWFAGIVNPPFPGGERLGGLMQAVGMGYYRVRDFV
ncbi:FAD-binding oxidoreductase [Curvibacter sp. APW13]|uniref:NAD(P)/FAD-dependent oxidoreductase n=1 Tax=Curvibacter sp. APW13 TaxID=3077236 RepID=UPI0028DD59CA|nr:FAD-binding oxidoreductase [Curvibacter sp. APW13]MDT8989626.1 FAD-binding oxidoreductase [Curvibacter sp. APW13]